MIEIKKKQSEAKDSSSYERLLCIIFFVMGVLLTTAFICLAVLVEIKPIPIVAILTIILSFYIWISIRHYRKLVAPFYRLTNGIESIRSGDYTSFVRSPFRHGVCAQAFEELNHLSNYMEEKKYYFEERTLLVYSLIEYLDSPVLVLNHHLQLIHANKAYSNTIGYDWHILRLTRADQLGLQQDANGVWLFEQNHRNEQFSSPLNTIQVRSSRFMERGKEHQLLILTDITKIVMDTQRSSWQQLIRVISHEINNSLTPIISLSQSLLEKAEDEMQKKILKIIKNRSSELHSFIKRYVNIYKETKVIYMAIDLNQVAEELRVIFPHCTIKTLFDVSTINADPILFKQTIINLVKNAYESMEVYNKELTQEATVDQFGTIELLSVQEGKNFKISIIDEGVGIQNPNNLFVPFYTTKANGQGIGLSFCRHIIELHSGFLTIRNRNSHRGAIATILLPKIEN